MRIKIFVFQIINFQIHHNFLRPNIIIIYFESRHKLLPRNIIGEIWKQIMVERHNVRYAPVDYFLLVQHKGN